MKNNRLPVYVLGALVVIAIIWRIANPPAPQKVGPLGEFPGWRSGAQLGTMSSQAMNAAGTMWAGAWNYKTRSAVWIIDLNDYSARSYSLKKAREPITCVTWSDDNTVRAIQTGENISVSYIDAATGKLKNSDILKTGIESIVFWPDNSDRFIGELSSKADIMTLALFTEKGEVVGKEVKLSLPKDAALYTDAGLSADGSSFVFSISDPAAGDGRSYYLADTKTGASKRIFDLSDVPGRIEGIWSSKSGVLVACIIKEKMETLVWNPTNSTAGGISSNSGADIPVQWPNALEHIRFSTYDGGYDFNLATGKTDMLFNMKKLKKNQNDWREEIRDSMLYPLKNGGFTSISMTGKNINIYELKKDGTRARSFLAKY